MNLKGKRALVTGGAVRIGRAITEALLAEGAEVIVHFRNSEKEAKVLSPKTIQADLGDPAQCETLLERASQQDRKSTRLNSSHSDRSRMPSSA